MIRIAELLEFKVIQFARPHSLTVFIFSSISYFDNIIAISFAKASVLKLV
jgi:hypothetical protein